MLVSPVMNVFAQAALLIGLPAGMVLSGYWLAGYLHGVSAAERFAVATLAGLATLLWDVTVVNLFSPLAGFAAWLCLWQIALTLILPTARSALWEDLLTLFRSRRGVLGLAFSLVFLVALLWPVLHDPTLLFYDGTSNHDSFFWIASAEYLKRATYLVRPTVNPLHPLSDAVGALIGWKPIWGRMGAEGLLALVSSLSATAAIKIYITATATLFVPWVGGVFLSAKTFLQSRSTLLAIGALVLLEPIFVFFHGNSNLPNLLGILMASAVVVASERALREVRPRWPWLALLALGFHGLMCAYPEMLPFVLMPAALLWLRRCFVYKPVFNGRGLLAVAGAFIVATLINPASTLRAYSGFINSFMTARANQNWANLFEPLAPTEYLPAMLTLCVRAGRDIGPIFGALFSIGAIVCLILLVRKSRDRYGAIAMTAGTLVLIAYTLETKFNYGWQKAIQFGGIFCAALVPVAMVDYLSTSSLAPSKRDYLKRIGLVALLAFCGYATALNIFEEYKWSKQKLITQDWFNARDFAREHLRNAPVLIDGASFRMAFFHGMWATYFLPESEVYFAGRGKENGGYVRDIVINEATSKIPAPQAYLVSRAWADTFDANSHRLFLGDTVALLGEANRVSNWTGFTPENGVPLFVQETSILQIRPHSRSRLLLSLAPSTRKTSDTAHWKVTRKSAGGVPFAAELSGQAPWIFSVPLEPNVENDVEFSVVNPTGAHDLFPPYSVRSLRVESAR